MKTYGEFWPYYLSQHRDPVCRWLHFVGTSLGLLLLGVAWAERQPGWIGAALLAGYGFAWIGHFVFEGNRPATFGHPFWSLFSDFRMYGLLWMELVGLLRGRRSERP